jgi:hypothetical protein
MASQAEIDEPPTPRRRRRIGLWAALVVLLLVLAALGAAWINRKQIADNWIGSQLASRGINATYQIERIGGRRQVLRNLVVGDPRHPDLTVEQAEVFVRLRFGFPAISEVRLVRPRLYGTYRNGKLSFGALDPLIFTGEKKPFEFPDFALRVTDGRALLESDYGPIGLKLTGDGHLRGGFAGELAATAPRLSLGGCETRGATLYGRVAIKAERPEFTGPVRLARLICAEQRIDLANAAVQLSARADKTLKVFDGDAGLRSGTIRLAENRLAALSGTSHFTWRDTGLTARYDLTGTGLATPQAGIARLGFDGWLRTRRNFERVELDSKVAGEGVRLGSGLNAALGDAAEATGDTLLGPLLDRVRRQLAIEGRRSSLTGELSVRRAGGLTSVVVPAASLRGSSGATLLSLSRLQLAISGAATPRFSGSFATGGEGLPRIAGRMERRPGGGVQVHASMAEYAAGGSRLAIPELVLIQRGDGILGFAGQLRASGALPGGSARNLLLPLSGNWSSSRGLTLWNQCTDLHFEALQFANLTLARQRLTLCPPRGDAIVRYGSGGLKIAAGAPSLQLAGRLGQTPIAIRSGPVGLAYPGAISARQLVVALGPADTASRFAINDLSAQIGKDVAGRFAGTDVKLFAVPLDLLGASGNWRYAGGRLTLTDGTFRLVDRQSPARFEPLAAEGASLALENNQITAQALLREPATGRAVTRVDLAHNLADGRGHADLAVEGLTFDKGFQPVNLTPKAFGVVANVRGTVTGTGRIDWSEAGVTSSGKFSSNSLDFAASFGPVKGASGTVEFSDLLGLTTAPNQRLRVASVNPGIEVTDGEIAFQLRNGELLALAGGTWPFMGGTLTMRAVEMHLGVSEERRYVLEIVGLDAAKFIERMELSNMSATGIFDGTVPLVFDAEGNGHVVDGLLLSRPPGGNISYIGQLTYENMGAIPNMAFAALRSLDYKQMRVAMNGDLTGEIVTNVRFDGVSQGKGAEQNIATRAIAGLPIRMEVNIRAPFYSLLGSIRAMYDPAAIRDPRDLGLLDAQGNPIRRETTGPPPAVKPEDIPPDEAPIQPRESETVR